MRFGKLGLGLVTATALLTAGTATASAATLTLGNPLTGSGYTSTNFGLPSGLINVTLASGAPATSPVDGTVIDWAIGGGDGSFAPFVAQPSGANFTGTAVGSAVAITPPGVSPRQPTNLPIKVGQVFGLNTPIGDIDIAPAGYDGYYDGLMTVGASGPLFAGGSANQSFAYNATVRYCEVPNLHLKNLTAARQALKNADCTLGTVTKPKNKKKRRKAKFVKAQSAAAGAKISDTAPVNLTLGPKPKKKHKK
jgi:hypothetical protein